MTTETNQTLTVADGRLLGFAEWGAADGRPVFHFHGSSSSRLEHPPEGAIPEGVRLITVDRPGHGLSTFQKKRRLLDWPADVAALADHLSIDQFAVTGWSFGGPHAMACAFALPERVTTASLVASFAPLDRPGAMDGMANFNKISLRLARGPRWIGRQFMKIQGRALRNNPEDVARRMLSSVPPADQAVFNDSQAAAILLPSLSEAYRNGADGPAWEGAMMVRPWGFRLDEITVPTHVWHGEDDVNNPMQCGAYLADTIPNATPHFLPGEGHFFIMKRWGEILATGTLP